MPNRSIRWSIEWVCAALLALSSGAVQAQLEKTDGYVVIQPEPATQQAEPAPAVVVPWTEPPPVNEIVIDPVALQPLGGEDKVFAQIMQEHDLHACEPGAACAVEFELRQHRSPAGPGSSFDPAESPVGSRRQIIEF